MQIGKKSKKKARAEPKQLKRSSSWLCSPEAYETLCCSGYTRLIDNPEIMSAVNKICDLISSMTIYLMENTEDGDIRIKNELSKKVDIYPNSYMTRKTFVSSVVRNLLLEGDGNSVVIPKTKQGYLEDLQPISPGQVSFVPSGFGYEVVINGVAYHPDDVLHFVINPDTNYPWKGTGYRITLKDVANNLKQAAATEKGFMESKWKPSVIVKVDSNTEELSDPKGREQILADYIESGEAGKPWLIPAEQFEVQVVKPLSLKDLALSDTVTLEKRTVAAILDVPPFVVGVGSFDKEEWNNWISTRIRGICSAIEQELSRKLIISNSLYWKFNVRSIYAYDISEIATVGGEMVDRMALRRNEWRDWLGFSPDKEMSELLALENYIPADKLGDQKKLQGGESE